MLLDKVFKGEAEEGAGLGWGRLPPINIHSTIETIILAAKYPSGSDVRKWGWVTKATERLELPGYGNRASMSIFLVGMMVS